MSDINERQMRWPDLAGRLIRDDAGLRHVLPVRVYFEDTDFSGVVYHASHLRWCERGRSDFLRLLGNDHDALLAGDGDRPPSAFVVRRMSLEYLRPARIDDVLEVQTALHRIGAADLELNQEIVRDGRPIFQARVTVVLVSLAGKPMRIGHVLRTALTNAG